MTVIIDYHDGHVLTPNHRRPCSNGWLPDPRPQSPASPHARLGITNETGDYTPERQIWTLLPWRGQAVFITAFFRDGDTAAEQETRAAYAAILASVARIPPGSTRRTQTPASALRPPSPAASV